MKVPTRDALTMAGIYSDGRSPGPRTGAVIVPGRAPSNRAERRLLSRILRRRAKQK